MMSVHIGKRGTTPNWIRENDWSPESRLEWASRIMAFSPRDWSFNHETTKHLDPELWALYIIINTDTKEEALETWWAFCDDNKNN